MMHISKVNPIAQADQNYVLDALPLDQLRTEANKDPKAAIRKVAGEFEAMFLNILMQSMRETSFSGEMDSSALSTYKSLFDQQTVQNMASGQGMGLGEVLAQYISESAGLSENQSNKKYPNGRVLELLPQDRFQGQPQRLNTTDPMRLLALQKPAIAQALARLSAEGTRVAAPASAPPKETGEFLRDMMEHARPAAQALGVAPHLIVAHAALESGWGKRYIKNPDGSNSHNLFGIKATRGWTGATTEIMTTEYIDGVRQKRIERFRSYPSYAHAFADYARMLQDNPRYKDALNKGNDAVGFAKALARGGYATDPRYAAKLSSVAGSTQIKVAMR